MKIRTLTVAVASLLAAATAFGGAAKGSCYSKAISLNSSQTAKLVAEYDSEEKETWDNGVAYYKITLSRGQAYTVWITGGNAENIELDVFTDDEYYEDREDEPSAGFDIDEIDGGALKVAYLYADDWDSEEDPSKGRYIVELDGEIGQTTTLNYARGIKNFTKVGTEKSPKNLSFSTGWKSFSAKMIDGAYYMSASLKAGHRYRVYVTGGKSGASVGLDVDGYSEDVEAPDIQPDGQYTNAYNDAWIVTPTISGKYIFVADGDTSQPFKFHYKMLPTLAIASHTSIPLLPENGYESKFVPGRISSNLNNYDEIIDEHLCRIYLAKGERWAFETVGADRPIEMIAYDSTGKVLMRNESADGVDTDARVVITASTAGIYYVGAYDPTLDVSDAPICSQITLTARNTADMPPPDEWDPVDDVYTGATFLTAVPDSTNQVVGATPFVSGPHRFGANDLYDCYAIDCRKGFTYRVTVNYSEESELTNRFTLASKTFYIASGKEKTVTTTGNITPYEISREDGLTFKSPVSGVVYVRIWVADGKGLDFPAYDIVARVTNGDAKLGLVSFDAVGAAGTFSLNAETVKYPSGSVLTLGTNANLKVVFNAPTGFKANPASTNVVIPAWTDADGAEPVKVMAKFYDIYDAKYVMSTKKSTKNGKTTTTNVYSPADGDATPAGAFAITPAYAAATAKRTFWADDPADHFTFTAATNVYYNLKLTYTTPEGSGDAAITVSNVVSGVVGAYDGVDEVSKALLPVGKTYVIVTHTNAVPSDSSYNLTYSRASGGIVKFKSTAVSVKEGSEYATLTVSRTGSEGAVKARYFTEAATALPGTNYYPVTDGVVSWNNGDKADKSIKIKMIPDLKAQWAASNLYFNVKLEPVDEYGLEDNEYQARLGASTAKVTITEASSKTPGTISLASFRDYDGGEKSVSNVKKPALSVTAVQDKTSGGTTNTLVFTRTGGTSGKVSITVKSVVAKSDTAKAGTDFVSFSKTLTWEDGDAEPKEVEFAAYARSDRDTVISRKFGVSMTVVKTGFTPTLSANSATVTVLNGIFTQTGAAYAKTIPAASGVKLATKGTWVVGDGRLGTLSNGSATFTLTGPGLFVCEPFLNTSEGAAGKLTYKFNKEAAVSITTNSSDRIVRIVGAGTTTFVVTLAGASGNVAASFVPQEDGAPYLFVPFKGAAPTWPMNKAVVETNLTELGWSVAEGIADFDGLYTRVRFGTAAKPTAVIATGAVTTVTATIPEALTPGKTYYWSVDYAYTNATGLASEDLAGLKWTSGPATWTFSTIKDGAPVTASAGGTDAAGNDFMTLVENGEPVELIQCLNVSGFEMALSGEGSSGLLANKFRLVAGKLPTGVSINATTGKLTGCPTATGTFTALLQSYHDKVTTTKKNGKTTTTHTYTYGTTIPVTFNVIPAGTAIGSWRGNVVTADGMFPVDSRQVGAVTLSATSAGKLTAKVTIAGVAYTFTGKTGYDELLERAEDPDAGDKRRFRVALKNTTKAKISGKTKSYTNYLTLEIDDYVTTNAAALAQAKASVELQMQVLNTKKTAVTADVAYAGDMIRNSGGTALGKAALADFAGYYTLGLVPFGVSAADGIPTGSGYLTLTIGATGAVKVSGVLADGTSVSFSSFAQLCGETLANPRQCKLMIPVGVSASAYAISGYLAIGYESEGAECPVVIPEENHINWVRNASTAVALDGKGFAMELAPTGGWYDKVVNLQAYYLERGFAIQAADDPGDLPIEALASGYKFSTSEIGLESALDYLPTPMNLALRFVGNTAKVDARKLVKNKTTELYDFEQSINPWNMTFKFTRATGIISGTFSAWEWVFKNDDIQAFATKQKEIKKLTHKGVWLYSRDSSSDSPLRDDAVSAGYFLMPTSANSKKWKASLPFSVIDTTEDPEPVWDERYLQQED